MNTSAFEVAPRNLTSEFPWCHRVTVWVRLFYLHKLRINSHRRGRHKKDIQCFEWYTDQVKNNVPVASLRWKLFSSIFCAITLKYFLSGFKKSFQMIFKICINSMLKLSVKVCKLLFFFYIQEYQPPSSSFFPPHYCKTSILRKLFDFSVSALTDCWDRKSE